MSQALSDLRMMLAYPDTLRDWFAGMAMQAKVVHFDCFWSDQSGRYEMAENVRRDGARLCYEIADAMMEARKPRSATEALEKPQ